eukprot:3399539-Amphidinium_carterae.1
MFVSLAIHAGLPGGYEVVPPPPAWSSHLCQGVKLEDRDGAAQNWETINLYVMNDYLVKPLTWKRQVCVCSHATLRKS